MLALLATLCLSSVASAQATQPATQPTTQPGFALTVYSTADPAFDWNGWQQQRNSGYYYGNQNAFPGYGVVRETRNVTLEEGRNQTRFTGVAAGIDPTTLQFRDFADPATSVLEQSYEYDLLDSRKLLDKFVGQPLKFQGDRTIELLSVSGGGIVYRDGVDGPIRISNVADAGGFVSQIEFPDTAGLILEPTLVWDVIARRGGEHPVQVTYETGGLTWRADYSLVTNADDTAVDVGAWVTLVNQSGLSYPDAKLKLVAGDVQRVTPPGQGAGAYAERRQMVQMAQQMQQFEEKSFFEYHLYTLGRPTTLKDNSTKQIELFPTVERVPAEKVYVYYGVAEPYRYFSYGGSPNSNRDLGTQSNQKVDVYLRFKNAEAAGMGIPLPAGKLRVYKRDAADDTLEFVGEDVLQHTPREETILAKLGSAFDLVGERRQTDFTVDAPGRVITESFEIKLRNRKTEPVTVIVKEILYRWANWEITASSHEYEKQDFRTIHIPVEVRPDEEATVTYTVRYTW